MTKRLNSGLRLTWLCPDDKGGGVVSVAQGCCKEAALAGHDVTLLLAIAPTGHATDYGAARLVSLDATPPYTDIPARLLAWLEANPQDILILNGCEQADVAIPFFPAGTRVVYGVHDTADRYFNAALRCEVDLDGIVAVSETVAERFRARIKDPSKLHVVHNGTAFPNPIDQTLARSRSDDLLFLGGDNAVKGAYDVLALWPTLQGTGFSGRLHWFGAIGRAMREKIAELPSADRIVLHGRQLRQQIFDLAEQSKVVLMLSRVEPFGMVTVECMGMGCLAVAWNINTGTKEIVGASEGIFSPLGDYVALASGVLRAIEMHGPNFAASTERIRREFSEAAMWERCASAFDSFLAMPPAMRVRAGQTPPLYRTPLRAYQLLPPSLRAAIGAAVGRSPRIGYALRNFRGK